MSLELSMNIRIIYTKALIIKNPPTSKIENKIANTLKYESIKVLIGSPNFFISKETRKNLALLPTKLASKNATKLILNAPALIVKSLNGIGVNPAVKIIQKFQSSYLDWILSKDSIEKPGINLKKRNANFEKSPKLFHHTK